VSNTLETKKKLPQCALCGVIPAANVWPSTQAAAAAVAAFRFQYGWDPAYEQLYLPGSVPESNDSNFVGTLAAVGRGFTACPSPFAVRERLVHTPLGVDKLSVCGDPDAYLKLSQSPATGHDGAVTNLNSSFGQQQQPRRQLQQQQQQQQQQLDLSSTRFLAHHMPSVSFDGFSRVLANHVSNCTLAALQLPECVISRKCSSALRLDPKATGKCATCASNAGCRVAWAGAAGSICDASDAISSGFLCYKKGEAAPGLFGGLLGLFV
jgi:hypothetical protein